MSAALILPSVWATATAAPVRSPQAERPTTSLAFYRKRTENLLRRYLQASLAVGRVPSISEDITVRGRTSSRRMKNFEDVVIFAIDVERCLKVLDAEALNLVVKIALQEYALIEVAEQLHLDVRTVARAYGAALDELTMILRRKKLMIEE